MWGHFYIPKMGEIIIYSFHMPLFFCISGYLYRNNHESIFESIFKKIRTLIIPYLFFATVSIPYGILINKYIHNSGFSIKQTIINFFFLNGSVGWNAPLWFLISLFIVSICFLLMDRSKISFKIWIPLLLILGYTLSNSGKEYPFALHAVVWGLIFYAIGSFGRKYRIIEKLNKGYKFKISIVILLMVNIVFGLILNIRVSVYHNVTGNYLYFYLAAISGILFLSIIASRLPVFRVLEFLGQNTFIIMATHYFFKYCYVYIDNVILNTPGLTVSSYLTSFLLTIFTLLCYVPIAYVYNKYFWVVSGRRKEINSNKSINNSF